MPEASKVTSSKRSPAAAGKAKLRVYTIGHSTLAIADFIERLRAFGVERLADVRSMPRSRHNPQFDRPALARKIRSALLSYVWMKGLGGLRHARKDSINTAWRNASFRGYADYMQTDEFARYLEKLVALAGEKPTAIMCAEAVPWRCHRSLIADALTVCKIEVLHITGGKKASPHRMTPWAKVRGKSVTYPATE